MGVTYINPYIYAGFSPLDLSPALWLDAADTSTITSSGSPAKVSQWNDKSGNARNVTQGVSATQPSTGVDTLNARNVISFNNHLLQTATLSVQTWFDASARTDTTFVLCLRVSTDATRTMSFGAQESGTLRLSIDGRSGTSFYDMGSATTSRVSGNDGTTTNQTNIVVARRSGASITVRRNGTQVLSSASASGSVAAGNGIAFRVGRTDGNNFFGLLAELIVFPSALSVAQIGQVETYLNAKWAVY